MKAALVVFVSILLLSALHLTTSAAEDTVYVYVEPASLELEPGQIFTVKIRIDPRDKGISSGEINVAFNLDVFEYIDIRPGDILGFSPLEGVKRIDDAKGLLQYAIARSGRTYPPTSPGVFAEIHFKVKAEANVGSYTIKLVKIGLADEKFNDIPNISIENAQVEIKIIERLPLTTTNTSPSYVTSPYYTYTSIVITQTPSTIYLILTTIITVSLIAVVVVLTTLYPRERRRKPRVLGVK